MDEKKINDRCKIIKNVFLFAFVAIIVKILYMNVVKYDYYANLADNKTYKDSDNIVWGKQELVWNEKNGAVKAYVKDLNQPVWRNSYTKLLGYYKQYLCDGYTYYRDSATNTTYETGSYAYVKTVTGASSIPSDTANTKYVLDNVKVELCSDCSIKPTPVYSYKVYTRTSNAVTKTEDELRATCNVKEYSVPIYGLEYKLEGYVKVATYIPVSSNNDQSLIKQGYVYTGVKREVK